jgi:hypothetical protein
MRLKPKSFALLSMFTMLVVGVTASAASAATLYEWKVGGAAVASGAKKEFTAKGKGSISLKWTVGGASLELVSGKSKVASGGRLIGGKPGTSEEVLELEAVKGVKVLEGCEAEEIKAGHFGERGRITTVPLKSEIVEGASGAAGNGTVELLSAPLTGTTVAQFEVVGSCGFSGNEFTVSGSVLAETTPQKAEAKVGANVFEPKTKEYKVAPGTGATKNAGLAAGGSRATLTGELETELVSKEAFGAY